MGSIAMANREDWPEHESSVDGSVGVDALTMGKSTLDEIVVWRERFGAYLGYLYSQQFSHGEPVGAMHGVFPNHMILSESFYFYFYT